MASVSGVCDMGNVIADVAMGGMGSVTGDVGQVRWVESQEE